MTDVIIPILFPVKHLDDAQSGPANIVLVPGLTEGEQEFILANKSQLGKGTARHAAVYTYSVWVMFRSIPIAMQLLILIAIILSIFYFPFVVMFFVRALQLDETNVRLIASMAACLVLVITIVIVHLVT